MTSKARIGYADNKARAVMTVIPRLIDPTHPALTAHPHKHDDLCDVFLMALWALWEESRATWALPRKKSVRRK
jgi:hypothetical protein